MRTYYDENRIYAVARLHPYAPGTPDQTGYIDFKARPELIESSLEDFFQFAHKPAVQAFYELLRDVNGARSHLETCDCAFRQPAPHNDNNSERLLSAHGRLYILFRELPLNCSKEHMDWLCQRMMTVLEATDSEMTAAEGVVGFTFNDVLHTALSNGVWHPNGTFECDNNDPGYGRHLMLSFWGYGNSDDEVFDNLERVFKNIKATCRSISDEINEALILNYKQT